MTVREAAKVEAHGVWIGKGDTQSLLWVIDGGFITDKALRSWVFHNSPDGYSRYVGPCILKMHVDQYAAHIRQVSP